MVRLYEKNAKPGTVPLTRHTAFGTCPYPFCPFGTFPYPLCLAALDISP